MRININLKIKVLHHIHDSRTKKKIAKFKFPQENQIIFNIFRTIGTNFFPKFK